MSFKFRGKDFQAWEEFELEPTGLTVLIGPSNEGKSSIVRALRALLRNELGQHFVRNAGKKLDVTFEFEGNVINATRTKSGSTVYQLDNDPDKIYKNLNGNLPEDVEKLALGPVRVGDTVLDPVFGRQSDKHFMLEEGPTALNAILGKFSSTERLEQGKREANSRIADKNSEAKTLAEQKRVAEELKNTLGVLVERADAIKLVVNRIAPQITTQENQLAALELLIDRRIRSYKLAKLLKALPEISTKPIERLLDAYTELTELTEARRIGDRLRVVVSKLDIPNVDDLIRVSRIVEHTGILAYSTVVLGLNRRWFEEAEQAIAAWRQVVAGYQKQKAINEVTTNLLARTSEMARQKANTLALMGKSIGEVTDTATTMYQRLTWLTSHLDRKASINRLNVEQSSNGELLAAARNRLEELETVIEEEAEAAREVAAAKAREKAADEAREVAARQAAELKAAQAATEAAVALAAESASRCPHCGEDTNSKKPGEKHEHSSGHIPTGIKGSSGNRKGIGLATGKAVA